MVWGCPTMPKRGAAEIAMRRSRSSLRPVTSACTGAWKPSAAALAGMSCTRPSVIRNAPATRSTGTSDSAEDSAPNSLVPSVSPSACPASTTRTSSPLIFFSVSTSASCALAVSWLRVPKFWLGLLSITTAATEDNGSRSSRVKEGLASASRISASAATRTAAPRDAAEQQQHRDRDDRGQRDPQHDRRNEGGERDAVLHGSIAPTARSGPARGPGRPCSCRSGCTSRC